LPAWYEFKPGPWVEALSAVGNETGYTARWSYRDADCLPQSAFRLTLWDETGTTIEDETGWVSSNAQQHTVTDIAAGDYIVTLDLRDTDDNENGNWAVAVHIGDTVGTSDPPEVSLSTPATGAEVSGTVNATFVATDDTGLAGASILIDGATVASWLVGGWGETYFSRSYEWDSAFATNGTHVIQALVTDIDGQTAIATALITVDNEGGGSGGSDDPTVSFVAPTDEAEVSGVIPIEILATDDAGLSTVQLKIDGGVALTWSPGGEGVTSFTATGNLDTTDYGNGDHTFVARAVDTNGNATEATITVTVANTAVSSTVYWFSEQFSSISASNDLAAQISELVSGNRLISAVELSAIVTQHATPENNAGLRFGIHCPGDSVDFSEYQSLMPDKITKLEDFGGDRQDARLAIEFFPLVDWDDWACSPGQAIDVQVVRENKLILLTAGPAIKMLSWNGVDSVATWLDLTGTWAEGFTGVAFRVLGDKCYIAAQTDDANPHPMVLVQDLDADLNPVAREPYTIELRSRYPQAAKDIEVVGDYVYFATGGDSKGHLWRISGDDVEPLVDFSTPPVEINTIWTDGTNLYCGCDDGTVLLGVVEDTDLGVDAVYGGFSYGSAQYALTGDTGWVWRKSGTAWTQFAQVLAFTQVSCAAVYRNRLWVGGNGPELYCYDFGRGVWQLYATLTDWTAITQLVAFAGYLCIFGTGSGDLFKALEISNAHITGRYVDEIALAIVRTEPVTT
jgi:hypothetical protein